MRTGTISVAMACFFGLLICGCSGKVNKKKEAVESIREWVNSCKRIRLKLKEDITFKEFDSSLTALQKEYKTVNKEHLPSELTESMQKAINELKTLRNDWSDHKDAKPSDVGIVKAQLDVVQPTIQSLEMLYVAIESEIEADSLK